MMHQSSAYCDWELRLTDGTVIELITDMLRQRLRKGGPPACLCDGWKKEEKRFLAPVKIMLLHIENQFLFLYFEMSMCCLGRNIWIIFFSLCILSTALHSTCVLHSYRWNLLLNSENIPILSFCSAVLAKCLPTWTFTLLCFQKPQWSLRANQLSVSLQWLHQ